MARIVVTVLIVAAVACAGDGVPNAAPRDRPVERYSNDVDGLSVAYPTTWHRAETPLAGRLAGRQVEVLGLATGALPDAEPGCSPYPWAAMRAMGAGDVILTVHVVADLDGWAEADDEPLDSRPDDLLAQEPMPPDDPPGGCGVDGVGQREVEFLANGREYRVFVAIKGDVEAQRRDELRAVWSSLRLRPISTGDGPVAVGEPYWHVLYTHCGIERTDFGGHDWVAEPVLADGNRNPPEGWGNPTEPGTMTLVGADRAEFRSRDGQRKATFRPRASTDPPAAICR